MVLSESSFQLGIDLKVCSWLLYGNLFVPELGVTWFSESVSSIFFVEFSEPLQFERDMPVIDPGD